MHANECKNIEVHYETLTSLKVDEVVTYKNEPYQVKRLLLD